ncbi:hypothetical protein NPIL_685841 [Nephila pilipes]|uniref:Uncharacterized protein n=1 Tax=Nephila pilipes TaxID=299642 RepID=A0A8X6MEH1_NEPPI|nr:hypothetical protein NPIL_685841 [Nephila pilipes]
MTDFRAIIELRFQGIEEVLSKPAEPLTVLALSTLLPLNGTHLRQPIGALLSREMNPMKIQYVGNFSTGQQAEKSPPNSALSLHDTTTNRKPVPDCNTNWKSPYHLPHYRTL